MVEMPDDWKAATARLTVLGRSGTGYLVAPNRLATCQRLVEGTKEGSSPISDNTMAMSRAGTNSAIAPRRIGRDSSGCPVPVEEE